MRFFALLAICSGAVSGGPISAVLTELNLQEFESTFRAAGVESAVDLELLSDVDLADLGLNLVQRRRLQHHYRTPAERNENSAGGLESVRTFGTGTCTYIRVISLICAMQVRLGRLLA